MLAALYYVLKGDPYKALKEDLESLKKAKLLTEDLRITEKGMELIQQLISKPISLKGKVVSGDGEGRYYLSLEGYRRQVREKLGFDPFPGTLNVLLDPTSTEKKSTLMFKRPIILKGFTENGKRYGEVLAFPARVSGVEAALVIPLKTHHPPEIIELISPVELRKALKLKDGDEVEVLVY
ncbi:DUF120 domain-containing protein [Ignicoccus hospitalis]|uniref:Riboflavin kinase n=1 Tax=Ignicoccus hospitalis (strain KIN4/I / DSM 18386 / JCM 14125) TaxID=453591 RepID=RIFK_IGNH4|nr:DUF120 domain-containing protein [Ignicoccus hospitalis]A8A9X7.1 RecName: Full=Riboflavin kinase; Short=RFK; AltName: Full=CTP-dependent riboflavin kinase; AltName: Full=CTP:riboflavin 5'-phosphotransferase; AltName: Full=Flavokinase [Ignicoccus hospitalis KIN4/I]ABU81729.1 protein of unknown function DUF120 [Ignicoccus hospitalis KIN4/I]HIH89993.1 DUF120 domain-containing protein [Desulfurococcaceae archaeon]